MTQPLPKQNRQPLISDIIRKIYYRNPRLINLGSVLSRSTYYTRMMEDKFSGRKAGHSVRILSLKGSITAPVEFIMHSVGPWWRCITRHVFTQALEYQGRMVRYFLDSGNFKSGHAQGSKLEMICGWRDTCYHVSLKIKALQSHSIQNLSKVTGTEVDAIQTSPQRRQELKMVLPRYRKSSKKLARCMTPSSSFMEIITICA